ncbi:MAG: tetratricopeptide repeat-containing sensor histidine kinase [Flavobacterium sp.]
MSNQHYEILIRKILYIFALLFSAAIQAQDIQKVIDSLKQELPKSNDEKKAAIYCDLTWHYSHISIDSALANGKKAIALTRKTGNDKMLAQVYSDLGAVYLTKGDAGESLKSYRKALNIRRTLNDSIGIASVWCNMGAVYERKAVPDSAMQKYIKALAYFEAKGDSARIDFVKNNIALLHGNMHNYDKAEKLYLEVARYRKATGQNVQLAMVYVNLGNLYKDQRKFDLAGQYYKDAAALAKKEKSAMVHSTALFDLGFLYNKLGRYKDALAYLLESRAVAANVHSDYDEALIDNGLGIAYYNLNDEKRAKGYYLKALRVMEKLKDRTETSRIYLDLVPVYGSLGMQDSADYYLQKYKDNEYLTLKEKVTAQTLELEAKYQTEKKERRIAEQNAEFRRKNTWLGILLMLVFFSVVIGYMLFRQQQLKNTQQQQEFELEAAISEIRAQNKLQEQRLEISKDLHDNIGAQLTFIISSIDTLKHAYPVNNPSVENRLTNISTFTRDTIRELRDTIWAMNNKDIAFEDLQARIHNFIENAEKASDGIAFSFSIDDTLADVRLTAVEGMNIYRIIQEAVNNVIKHSGASAASIIIQNDASGYSISIKDNGRGFDPDGGRKGNGLYNMQKRTEDIGGTFKATSAVDGTTITLHFKQARK